jgi:hypothetical protein
MKGCMMRTGWMLLGLLAVSAGAWADEAGRYEALPLAGAEVTCCYPATHFSCYRRNLIDCGFLLPIC